MAKGSYRIHLEKILNIILFCAVFGCAGSVISTPFVQALETAGNGGGQVSAKEQGVSPEAVSKLNDRLTVVESRLGTTLRQPTLTTSMERRISNLEQRLNRQELQQTRIRQLEQQLKELEKQIQQFENQRNRHPF